MSCADGSLPSLSAVMNSGGVMSLKRWCTPCRRDRLGGPDRSVPELTVDLSDELVVGAKRLIGRHCWASKYADASG